MSDDRTGLALRDHLDDVLAGLAPRPTLLDDIYAARDRRLSRRTAWLAAGSALTAAAATAAVIVGANAGAVHHHNRPAGQHPVPAASPTYGQPQPDERWFTGPFAFPRPTGEIAVIPLPSEERDPAGSRRSLLVWYGAAKDSFCAMEVLQEPDHPDGEAGGGGGCSDTSAGHVTHTGLVMGSETCDGLGWKFWFGVIGADAPTVEVHGIGGPDPQLIVRRLDGAPRPFFVALGSSAPRAEFRYLAADGHLVRHQSFPHAVPAHPLMSCLQSPASLVTRPG